MKKIYYFEEPSLIRKKNGIVEMIGKANALRDVDAIYTENSAVKNILGIYEELRYEKLDIPIYVVTNPYRESLLHALVPSVEVISSNKSPEDILSYIGRSSGHKQKAKVDFTQKEKLVLEEIGYGLCDKEICETLHMSERTVRRYKTKLLEKTGLLSSGQLGLYAISSQFES